MDHLLWQTGFTISTITTTEPQKINKEYLVLERDQNISNNSALPLIIGQQKNKISIR